MSLLTFAERGAGGLFGALARALRGRPLHPTGAAFAGTLEVPGATAPELGLFAAAGTHPVLLRFSRGFGLPEPLPEILSLAVKVPGAYGPGRAQDLLMTASRQPPGLRHTFAAGRSHLEQSYSSILPFSAGGRTVLLGALPHTARVAAAGDLDELRATAAAGLLGFDLRIASLRGPWRTLGTVRVGRPLSDDEERALTFNSDTTGGGLAAIGAVNRLRGAAYDASTRARPTDHPG